MKIVDASGLACLFPLFGKYRFLNARPVSLSTHLSLDKDAPVSWKVQAPGRIVAKPLLGGLHHQYAEFDFR